MNDTIRERCTPERGHFWCYGDTQCACGEMKVWGTNSTPAGDSRPAPEPPAGRSDEYYLAMAALNSYPIDDGLPKSTSVVYRIHQLGHALQHLREATLPAQEPVKGFNADRNWLKGKAAQEDGCFVSAGTREATPPVAQEPPLAEYHAVPRDEDGPIRIALEMRSAAHHDRTKDACTRSALAGWADRLDDWMNREVAPAPAREATRPPCSGCGGPHPFDTTVPSVVWNDIIRGRGLPDYLCLTCIVRAFALVGRSFTAELVGGDGAEHLEFVPIEVSIDSQESRDAVAISNENTMLRARITELERQAPAREAVCEYCGTRYQPVYTTIKSHGCVGQLLAQERQGPPERPPDDAAIDALIDALPTREAGEASKARK